jgi:hypothetical protein
MDGQDTKLSDSTLTWGGIADIRNIEPGCWLGIIEIGGIPHHALFVQVTDEPDGVQKAAHECNELSWEDVCRLYNYPYCTVELPGVEGDFVLVIHPYSR